MGYGDFEFIGGATDTPNMNRLAAEGVWFKNFYAAAPNCSPSRAGLLTGKNPQMLECIVTCQCLVIILCIYLKVKLPLPKY